MPPPEESLPRQSQPHPQPQHAYPPHPIHKPHPSQPPPPPPPPQVQQNQTEDRQYQYPNYHDHNTYYPEYSNGYSYQQQYPYPPSKPLFMLSEKHRIFKLLLIGVPIMVYILILAMIDPNLSYYDLGLWLFIIISAIMIANFGTFIPVINRAQIIGALGIIILIDSPLALVLNTLNVFQIGFWYLIGLIYIFISYDIIINDQNQKNDFETH